MTDWEAVGLTAFDARVYRRLLYDPGVPVPRHAEAMDVPAAAVEEAVDRLALAGLIRSGSADGPSPVDPRSGLAMLVHERRTALDRVAALTDQLAREFSAGRLRAEPDGLVEIAVGREAIEARIDDLLRGATRGAVGTDAPPYVADGSHQVSAAELALLGRGVRFRSIYAAEVLDHPDWVARLTSMAEAGEQARVLPRVPVKLLVVDGTTAVVPLAGDGREMVGGIRPGQARAVILTESALTSALQVLFDLLWDQAAPLRLTGTPAKDPARTLLGLLASGMTDDAIARRLGISGRTLRRRIAQVQDQLGAANRFQAGLQASRRGWV